MEWRLDDGAFHLEATVPEGVEADVVLPDGEPRTFQGGTHSFDHRIAAANLDNKGSR